MKRAEKFILETVRFMLILLWVYTAASKLFDFSHFRVQMQIQTLPIWLSGALVYVLPGAEIIAAVLLLFQKTLRTGLYLSSVMMTAFTCYVGLVLINFFGRVPCSCGGVISQLDWRSHFIFNLIYLLLACYGIYITYRERRDGEH